ncbi:helicase HerA-like domain-containing protein [Caulobacter segnis]
MQEGVLTIAFHVADQDGLLLLDLKDLQAALKYVADHADEIEHAVRQRRPRHGRGDPAQAADPSRPKAPKTSSANPALTSPT